MSLRKKGSAVLETMLLTAAGVAAVGLIGFFVQDWISKAGRQAVAEERVYNYSPARHCLPEGTVGIDAAVVQDMVSTGPQAGHILTTAYRFRLSRDLREQQWDSDFNMDGDADDIISGTPTVNAGGLVFLIHQQNSQSDIFRVPPRAIVFAGNSIVPTSVNAQLASLHVPLGEHTDSMYVIPAGTYAAAAAAGSPVYSPTSGLVLSSPPEAATTEENLRLWQATLIPARLRLPERTIYTEAVEFAAAVVVNPLRECWTLETR